MQSHQTPHIVVGQGTGLAETARDLFGNVDVRFCKDFAVDARLVSAALGPSRLSRIDASPHLVTCRRVATRSHDADAIKLIMQLEGRSIFRQDAASVVLAARSWIIYDPTRSYNIDNVSPVSQLLLQVQRHNFSPAALQSLADPLTGSDHGGVRNVLLALMQSTIMEAQTLDETDLCSVGEALVRLTTGIVAPLDASLAGSLSLNTLRRRAKNYIEGNLSRFDLDIEQIARHMGCSRRYLFRAFEAEGGTPSEFIWRLRLQRAHERLTAPRFRSASISDIAFSCGFSSSAHFSRSFRKYYGVPPREVRPGLIAA